MTIGRPVANARVYLLDARGEPVPAGVPGELFMEGAGLSRGYLDRPEMTAEKFVPDPFAAVPGSRLYRVGDLARRRPDGELEYLGRVDHQVKIRGFRVELGEIEAALARHPGVREAVVMARDDGDRGKRLVAYVTPRGVASSELRSFLRESLPDYMVPTAFVHLDALPLSPNGKIDRRALPDPGAPAAAPAPVSASRGPVTEALTALMAEVLGVEGVGESDDFFELGGHSLLATRLAARASRLFGVEVPVSAVLLHPTPAALAAQVARRGRHGAPGAAAPPRGRRAAARLLRPAPALVPRPPGAGEPGLPPPRRRAADGPPGPGRAGGCPGRGGAPPRGPADGPARRARRADAGGGAAARRRPLPAGSRRLPRAGGGGGAAGPRGRHRAVRPRARAALPRPAAAAGTRGPRAAADPPPRGGGRLVARHPARRAGRALRGVRGRPPLPAPRAPRPVRRLGRLAARAAGGRGPRIADRLVARAARRRRPPGAAGRPPAGGRRPVAGWRQRRLPAAGARRRAGAARPRRRGDAVHAPARRLPGPARALFTLHHPGPPRWRSARRWPTAGAPRSRG